MLSSLKKPSDKPSGVVLPAWHPNFRNFEQLPDIKVVRTTFFINGVSVLVALSLVIYTIYREVELSTLVKDTQLSQEVVQRNKPPSDLAVAQFKQFQQQEKKVLELQEFLATEKIKLSEFLINIGGSLKPAITLASIEYKPTSVALRGSIRGSSEEAAKLAQDYVESLKVTPYLADLFNVFTLTSIVRDPGSGDIRFEVDLEFNKATPKTAGGKK